MKMIPAYLLALVGPFVLSGCISVKTQRTTPSRETRTTTEQTTVHHPHSTTVETETTRSN